MRNRQLADLLARNAYEEGDFTLSSGAKSGFYLDAKVVTYDPRAVELIGQAILEVVQEYEVESVGGLTMGADAIVISTVWASVHADKPLPGFVVRKEAKKHGKGKWIEGVHPRGKRVAIVDDVITKGGSVLKAVEAVQSEGATVAVVVCLIDREEGGDAAVRGAGIPFRSLCTLTEIRECAVSSSAAV